MSHLELTEVEQNLFKAINPELLEIIRRHLARRLTRQVGQDITPEDVPDSAILEAYAGLFEAARHSFAIVSVEKLLKIATDGYIYGIGLTTDEIAEVNKELLKESDTYLAGVALAADRINEIVKVMDLHWSPRKAWVQFKQKMLNAGMPPAQVADLSRSDAEDEWKRFAEERAELDENDPLRNVSFWEFVNDDDFTEEVSALGAIPLPAKPKSVRERFLNAVVAAGVDVRGLDAIEQSRLLWIQSSLNQRLAEAKAVAVGLEFGPDQEQAVIDEAVAGLQASLGEPASVEERKALFDAAAFQATGEITGDPDKPVTTDKQELLRRGLGQVEQDFQRAQAGGLDFDLEESIEAAVGDIPSTKEIERQVKARFGAQPPIGKEFTAGRDIPPGEFTVPATPQQISAAVAAERQKRIDQDLPAMTKEEEEKFRTSYAIPLPEGLTPELLTSLGIDFDALQGPIGEMFAHALAEQLQRVEGERVSTEETIADEQRLSDLEGGEPLTDEEIAEFRAGITTRATRAGAPGKAVDVTGLPSASAKFQGTSRLFASQANRRLIQQEEEAKRREAEAEQARPRRLGGRVT